jgi:hypothetical protein
MAAPAQRLSDSPEIFAHLEIDQLSLDDSEKSAKKVTAAWPIAQAFVLEKEVKSRNPSQESSFISYSQLSSDEDFADFPVEPPPPLEIPERCFVRPNAEDGLVLDILEEVEEEVDVLEEVEVEEVDELEEVIEEVIAVVDPGIRAFQCSLPPVDRPELRRGVRLTPEEEEKRAEERKLRRVGEIGVRLGRNLWQDLNKRRPMTSAYKKIT